MDIPFASEDKDVDGVSTGLPQLDRAIGPIRGIPIDRMTLITGNFSTGKSSLALFIVGQAQIAGMECLWLDSEGTFDKYHARMCGADPTKIRKLKNEDTYAQALLQQVEDYVSANKNTIVVIDSFGALSIRDEVEKDMEGADFGAKTKMFARFLRKIVPKLAPRNCTLIVIAHEYAKMGTGAKVLVGGDAMQKFPSLWIALAQKFGVSLKSGGVRVGDVLEATIKKNKVGGIRYATADLQFVYGQGFNPMSDFLQDALDRQIITKTGNSYFLGSEKIAVGKPKLDEWAKEHADELKEALA